MILGVRVCLDCGLIRVQVDPGEFSVFVVGPGAVGDKLDTLRRDRLLTWLRANPDSGLEADLLARQIPRLPFVLITAVSKPSAEALIASLTQLGIRGEFREGGRFSHGNMLEKTARIGARRSQTALPLLPFLIVALPLLVVLLLISLPLLPVYLTIVGLAASRSALSLRPGARRVALPPQVEAQVRKIEIQAPRLGARHRPALRAIVQRVMALVADTEGATDGGSVDPALDLEMAHALSVAVVGTTRLGELDAAVSRPDFDSGDPEQRRDLHERDMWAARLLELSATLDALASRHHAARQTIRAAELDADSPLAQLRERIEALEEIQTL